MQPIDDVRVLLGELELLERLEADHRLVHEHVVEDGAEAVLLLAAAGGGDLDGLGDGDAERARRVRILLEDRAAGVRLVGRARSDARAEGLHQAAAVRLLVVGDPDHVDVAPEAEERAGHGERAAPLAGPRFRGQPGDALLLVVERLRDCRVGLVRAGRRDALVLVVEVRRGVERLLEAARTDTGASAARAGRCPGRGRGSRSSARGSPPGRSAPSGRAARGRRGRSARPCPGGSRAGAAAASRPGCCTRPSGSPSPPGGTSSSCSCVVSPCSLEGMSVYVAGYGRRRKR